MRTAIGWRGWLVASVLLALAGCSGEPSESDIAGAFDVSLAQASAAATQMAGKDVAERFRVQVHSVKKLGCAEADDGGYRCDVTVDSTAPIVGRTTQTSTIRLREGDEGWLVVGP